MRRIALLLVLAGTLSGCAISDRFAYARQDPFIWFLSGMPAPYDLNFQRGPVPDLPVLNPVDYVPIAPPQPLDYPRGWNPDNPPLLPSDLDAASPAPQPAPVAQPETRCVAADCANTPPVPTLDTVAAGADAGVRADGAVAARADEHTAAVRP